MRSSGSTPDSRISPLGVVYVAPDASDARPAARTASQQKSDLKEFWGDDGFQLVGTDAVQLFAPPEHVALGDAASLKEHISEIDLGDGTQLTFGTLVALSGDWVASADELRKLASTPEGREELRYARWSALTPEAPEPNVSPKAKENVRARYLALAADNSGHFSHGGSAIENYQRGHREAVRKAREAGAKNDPVLFAKAVTDEACCQHFLSDCFSSGHVRVPIVAIRDYYRKEMTDSLGKVYDYAASRVAVALADRGDVPWYWPRSTLVKKIRETIERSAGSGVESFSLGDVVVLSYHNADCNGLDVVSEVEASGRAVPGGFKWRAIGDKQLVEGSVTWNMAVAAMRASRAELDEARGLGAQGFVDAPTTKAERFIPTEDTSRASAVGWKWGAMDDFMVTAINATLRGQLLDELRRASPQPPIQRYSRSGKLDPNGAVVLHVAEAFEVFCKELEADGIKVLERAIGEPARA